MDIRELPREERVCVNCAHYLRKINPVSLLDFWLDDGQSYHRCTLDGRREDFNIITGKKKIAVSHISCLAQKAYNSKCNSNNHSWAPSERWKRRKENLFKILKT